MCCYVVLPIILIAVLLIVPVAIALNVPNYLIFIDGSHETTSTVFVPKLSNRGSDEYGIEPQIENVNSHKHDGVTFSTECNLGHDVTVALVPTHEQIQTVVQVDQYTNSRLSFGPAFSDLYSTGNFTFDSEVMWEPGSKFNFLVDRISTSDDIQSTVCNKTVEINNESSALIKCPSDESGFFSGVFSGFVPQDVNGTVNTTLTYDIINVNYYSNWTLKCIINNKTRSCTIPLKFKDRDYTPIIILSSEEYCDGGHHLSIKYASGYAVQASLITNSLPIALFCCMCIVITSCCCCRKKVRQSCLKTPIGETEYDPINENRDDSVSYQQPVQAAD